MLVMFVNLLACVYSQKSNFFYGRMHVSDLQVGYVSIEFQPYVVHICRLRFCLPYSDKHASPFPQENHTIVSLLLYCFKAIVCKVNPTPLNLEILSLALSAIECSQTASQCGCNTDCEFYILVSCLRRVGCSEIPAYISPCYRCLFLLTFQKNLKLSLRCSAAHMCICIQEFVKPMLCMSILL